MGRVPAGVLCAVGAAQQFQHGFRVALAVIGHVQQQQRAFRPRAQHRPHGDAATAGVVAGSVVQQVFQRAAQQRGVAVQYRGVGALAQFQFHLALTGCATVAEISHAAPQQRPGAAGRTAQRLGVVLQLAGQVQVLHQRLDAQALAVDAACLLALGGGQGIVGGKLLGIAGDQRQRRADVVGNAGDPVGAGGVPPGDQLALALQPAAGLVEPAGQLGGHALFRQADRFALGQLFHTLGHRFQLPAAPPAQPQAEQHHHRQVCQQDPAQVPDNAVHQLLVDDVPAFPLAAAGGGGHQQAAAGAPAAHRVIVQVPSLKARHVPRGIMAIQLRRQPPLPDDVSVRVQQHGPLPPLQQLPPRIVQRRRAGLVKGEMVGQLHNIAAVRGSLRVAQRQRAEQRKVHRQHQNDDQRRRHDVAPDHAGQRFHCAPSPASL